MEKELKLLRDALEHSRKSERKYRIIVLIDDLLIVILGILLIIFTSLNVSGCVFILSGIVLYAKMHQMSIRRTTQFENLVKTLENECQEFR